MKLKAVDRETEILRLRDRQAMAGLWEVRASALGSNDEVSESLTMVLDHGEVAVGREPCWLPLTGFEWQ